MDSITQAALGAAVAHAGLGRTLGRKAIGWGLLLGTLPDLDILAYPWMDAVDQLAWHRGISHSVLAVFVGSIVVGWLLAIIPRKEQVGFTPAAKTVAWIWSTHILIDVFTVYGTMVWEPFSHERVALNNMFIIDPLYTLPILIGLLGALIGKSQGKFAQAATSFGLGLSTLYAGWSFASQAWAQARFETQLTENDVQFERAIVSATPFNTILWRGLFEVEGGYLVGYSSHFDDAAHQITFEFIPKNEALIEAWRGDRAVEQLRWFSREFFTINAVGDELVFSDIRFGELPGERPQYLFNWALNSQEDGSITFEQQRPEIENPEELLSSIWQRVRGAR